MAPKISVVLPINNSAKYLTRAIDSIVEQTFGDWELLAVNEAGSQDGSAEIVKMYSRRDERIRLLQNEQPLGLAESLNRGIRESTGEYIARMDADDISHRERFAKQYAYMQAHPEVGVCGTYQRHFGGKKEWTHRPPESPEDMKAALLFHCNICHSTVMLRRSVFVANGLYYDGRYKAEDFELWSRALGVTAFATIPEVLGEYRKGGANITAAKKAALLKENGQIAARTLRQQLGIELTEEQTGYFQGWDDPFRGEKDAAVRQAHLSDMKRILREIYDRNEERQVFARESLVNMLCTEWRYVTGRGERLWSGERYVQTIEQALDEKAPKAPVPEERKSVPERVKAGVAARLRRGLDMEGQRKRITQDVEKRLGKLETKLTRQAERRTGELSAQLREQAQALAQVQAQADKPEPPRVYLPYRAGEKLRAGVLVTSAADWPALESVWRALAQDGRTEAKLYVYGGQARGYMESIGEEYEPAGQYTLAEARPHVLIRRISKEKLPVYLQSEKLSRLGIRQCCIPEQFPVCAQSEQSAAERQAWGVFTSSERVQYDHICQSEAGWENEHGAGAPILDGLRRREAYPLEEEVRNRIGARKLVVMYIHGPEADEAGRLPQADIDEYTAFITGAAERWKDCFFLVLLGEDFAQRCSAYGLEKNGAALQEAIEAAENAALYTGADHRRALYGAAYVIADRSDMLLESAAAGIPALYMHSFYCRERLLPGIEPVYESLYQGTCRYDMDMYLDMVGEKSGDYKAEERRRAAKACLPAADGENGRCVLESVLEAMAEEAAR